jgi:hypothetical protein
VGYTKLTLEVVVHDDEEEVLTQALNNALDALEEHIAVYHSEIRCAETSEPENAAEIAAPVN